MLYTRTKPITIMSKKAENHTKKPANLQNIQNVIETNRNSK